MEKQRTSDPKPLAVYRSDRVILEDGKWFFFTREGTIEGPFRDKVVCLNQLDMYIKVMQSGMLSERSDTILNALYKNAS